MVQMEHKACKVTEAPKVHRAPRVHKAQRDHKAQRVLISSERVPKTPFV